ncbi:recombinase family protein [Microvirga antarctica]|uniref:recombinase family protein n=1 Tax=Microvirga antarctica TaxID=2819233 RepID=UPI001B3053BB|nr:recombinase family protein [Microvirga antarctica]
MSLSGGAGIGRHGSVQRPGHVGLNSHRPGYQPKRGEARCGSFDVVIVEPGDRLARKLVDVAAVKDGLSFQASLHGVDVVHDGMLGPMAAIFPRTCA